MKKVIAIIMAGVLFCTTFIGCGADQSAEEELEVVEENVVSETIKNTSVETESATVTTVEKIELVLEDEFSDKDYQVDAIYDSCSVITLSDGGSSSDQTSVEISGDIITITEEGSYMVSGTLSDGQIVVEADDSAKVQLLLDGVTISNETTAPIYVAQADKVFVTTVSGSKNQLTATLVEEEAADTNIDAAIFSKEDLTLNGEGNLTIMATNGNGITSKDDLVVTGGLYEITADKHGFEANNSIRIADGIFSVISMKDGFHCAEEEDMTLGYIYIVNGEFTIDAMGDGFDTSSQIEIVDGDFDIITGGGNENYIDDSRVSDSQMFMSQGNIQQGGMGSRESMQGGMNQQGGMGQGTMPEGEMSEGEILEGEMPEGELPEMVGQQSGMSQQSGRDQGTMLEGEISEGEMSEGELPEMAGQQGGMSQQSGRDQGTMLEGEMSEGEILEGEMPEGELPEMAGQQSGMNQQGGMGQGTMPEGEMLEGEMLEDEMSEGEMLEDQMSEGDIMEETLAEEDTDASMKAFKADSYLIIHNGDFTIDACDDAMHSNVYLEIWDGTFAIQTGDDALHANYSNFISGGTIDIITCYEGIEGQKIDIIGGAITITSNDDGINSARSGLDIGDSYIYINIEGGTVIIDAYEEGDGLDSNGDITMSGGELIISSTTDIRDTALDYASSSSITGGIFFATGSTSQTRQNFGEDSTQASIMQDLSQVQSGEVLLVDSSGNTVIQFTPVKEYQTVTLSSPDLKADETYTLTAGSETFTIVMDGFIYGQNSDQGPGGR